MNLGKYHAQLTEAARLINWGWKAQCSGRRSGSGRYDGILVMTREGEETVELPIEPGLTAEEVTVTMKAVKAALEAHVEHGTPFDLPPGTSPLSLLPKREQGEIRADDLLTEALGTTPDSILERGEETELRSLIGAAQGLMVRLNPGGGKKGLGGWQRLLSYASLAEERLSGRFAPGN